MGRCKIEFDNPYAKDWYDMSINGRGKFYTVATKQLLTLPTGTRSISWIIGEKAKKMFVDI